METTTKYTSRTRKNGSKILCPNHRKSFLQFWFGKVYSELNEEEMSEYYKMTDNNKNRNEKKLNDTVPAVDLGRNGKCVGAGCYKCYKDLPIKKLEYGKDNNN